MAKPNFQDNGEVLVDAEYGEDNLTVEVDGGPKLNSDVTFLPPGIESDGGNAKIEHAKIKKSIVQIGDVFVFNNIGTDEKSDNVNKLPDVIDKIHQMNGHVIANKEQSLNGKWPKLLKYTILKYTLIVAFGLVVACGIIFSIVYLLMSNKEKDSSIAYDDQNWDYNTSFRLVARKEWGAIKVDPKPKMLAIKPAKLVIISHTASPKCHSLPECSVQVRNIQAFHIERDLGDIGYNFLLGGDGNVYVGRGWEFEGAHTKHYNNISIGISFIGNFVSQEPTKKQIQAGFDLIQNGLSDGKIAADYELYGHRQLINTASPGDKVMEIIQKWPHWSTKS